MSIQKVEMFKCSDGTLCTTEAQAIKHETQCSLWDKALADYGRYDEVTFPYKDDMIQFLRDNKEEIIKLLENN